MDQVTDRHDLEVLSLSECLTLLASRPLGRLAYVDRGVPHIVPVNHLVDGNTVIFRALHGAKTDALLLDRPVAFEVDDHDPSRAVGWSVLVHGTAHPVTDEESRRFAAELESWAAGTSMRHVIVRLVPDEVTGRRLKTPE
ncbi:MAG: pyridoxamine 5'-phosphate oxidase family protein [Actinobacteria bacterium]|jgi:nitroimidazol reductase NimA-like FMN-containing flavoprotein (pyridoxamine 5'-phosphate oxidase superfamily)|nr:pyridoxamine 5'-phosphate oxidase family protein [Actinomycetota bacterium]